MLALAIQDVPRPLWSDVALRRLRGAPGVQADLLNVKTLEGVYKKLLDKAPHLLGKTSAHGPVLTPYEKQLEVVSPLQTCIFCPEPTALVPTNKCLQYTGERAAAMPRAVTYNDGLVPVLPMPKRCPGCSTEYLSCWAFRGDRPCVACDPRDCEVFQTHERLRGGDICFVDQKYLRFVSGSLLHSRAAFNSFGNLLLDVFDQCPRRPDSFAQRVVEHAWFNFEALALLWDVRKQTVRGMAWDLRGDQAASRFLQSIEPALRHAARTFAGDHKCALCEVPVLGGDGKWNISSKICNNRSSHVHYNASVGLGVMVGCTERPAARSLYCRSHQTEPESVASASAPGSASSDPPLVCEVVSRKLRGQEVMYRLRGKTKWAPSDEVPQTAVRAFDESLARQKTSRPKKPTPAQLRREDPARAPGGPEEPLRRSGPPPSEDVCERTEMDAEERLAEEADGEEVILDVDTSDEDDDEAQDHWVQCDQCEAWHMCTRRASKWFDKNPFTCGLRGKGCTKGSDAGDFPSAPVPALVASGIGAAPGIIRRRSVPQIVLDPFALAADEDVQGTCNTDKGDAAGMSRRKYHGIFVTALPCQRVVTIEHLVGSESLPQVYLAFADALLYRRNVKFLMYDNACALARFARGKKRINIRAVTRAIAAKKFILPSSHESNHIACRDPQSNLYMPEVVRSAHKEVQKGLVDLEANEQIFAWVERLAFMVNFLSPVHRRLFVFLMCHAHNKWLEKTGWLGFRKGAARRLRAGEEEVGENQRPMPQYFQLLKRKKTGRAERSKAAEPEIKDDDGADDMLAELDD